MFWWHHHFHVMVFWVSKSQGKKLSKATQQIDIYIYEGFSNCADVVFHLNLILISLMPSGNCVSFYSSPKLNSGGRARSSSQCSPVFLLVRHLSNAGPIGQPYCVFFFCIFICIFIEPVCRNKYLHCLHLLDIYRHLICPSCNAGSLNNNQWIIQNSATSTAME